MGTNCAPAWANLILRAYEHSFFQRNVTSGSGYGLYGATLAMVFYSTPLMKTRLQRSVVFLQLTSPGNGGHRER